MALLLLVWGCVWEPVTGTWAAAAPPLESLTGSSAEFVVTSWQMRDGLPSDRVRAVLQTADSYLWLATFNGAARFDGVRFGVFNDANTPALRNNLVSCLFQDAAGRLWLGSDTGELTWCDAAGFHPLVITNEWPSFPIDRFAQSEDGTLWVLNREGFLLAVKDFKAQAVLGALKGPLYSDIVRDTAGRVWAVQYGGDLVQLVGGRPVAVDQAPKRERNYRTIARARRGGLWVRDGNRLRRWDRGQWVEERGTHSWGTQQAVVLFEATSSEVWVGTRHEGVFMVGPDGAELHLTRTSGLPQELVSSITEDREGNIWVGSDAGGLAMLRPRALFMVAPPDQWQHRSLSSVAPSRDGGLWVGTQGAGVYKLRGAQATCLSTSNNPIAQDVRAVVEDRAGRLWVGTEVRERVMSGLLVEKSLGRFEASTRGAGLLLLEGDQLRPLRRTETRIELPLLYYAIYQSTEGTLWLGSDHGLVCAHKGQWSRLGTDLYRPEVRCLTETPDGALWLGLRGGGVARYYQGHFTQFLRAQGLPYEYVWAILGDADGSVWIGTPGAGLIRWRNGQFVSFTTRQGLPSDFICSIQADAQGYLWLGSYAGILKIAKTELERCARDATASVNCFVLDSSDGLTSLEMAGGTQPAACATADGRLWFATSGGLAMVDPSRIRTNALPPPIGLEEILVDGHPLPFASAPARLSGRAAASVVQVPPGSGQIELRYTALSFCAPPRVRFRYRLAGVDPTWMEAGTRRSAYYSHLQPGTYRFHVIACNNDGVWNPEGATVALTVLPYLWQTWWFAPACWLGGIGLLGSWGFTWLRRRHRARVEALERARLLERERGRIARDLHDDLGSGLTDISTTSALGQDPSVPLEEARQYFGEISQRSNEMVSALDEIVWAVNPKNDDLASLATYLSQFTESFLRRTALRCRFDIPPELPRLPLNAEQRHSLFLAFKEALQNAVKHSAASSLSLRLAVAADTLTIALEDNGGGFDLSATKLGADGLRNMRERLEQLGGACEIATAPGQGTRVTFHVPIYAAH